MQLPVTNPNPAAGETRVNIYGYVPSFPLGVATVVLFALFLLSHLLFLVQSRRQQKRQRGIATFETLFIIGCILEIVGYSFRLASHAHPYVLRNFVLNYFMIVVAPVFFSAGLYYSFSLFVQGPQYTHLLPLSPRLLVGLFVVADVVTIVIQIVGAALIGVGESNLADGKVPAVTPGQANKILTAGLAVQCASFCAFLIIVFTFVWRFSAAKAHTRQPLAEEKQISANKAHHRRASLFLVVLIASSLLVFLRTTFRLAEASPGELSPTSLNEHLFAALETAPVLAAVFLWSCRPLAWLLREEEEL